MCKHCQKNVRKLSFQPLRTIFGHFSDILSTFFGHFVDIFRTFSGLSNGLPVTTLLAGKKISEVVWMARLQTDVGTKRFVSRHEFSHEKCSETFPEFFEPFFLPGGGGV